MGALADFIATEFIGPSMGSTAPAGDAMEIGKSSTATATATATLATPADESSKSSRVATGPKSAHYCSCGAHASVGLGWFVREQNRARWYCASCLPSKGRA
jgi:hypothetical protein